jgi:hypothetical protein
MTLISCLWNNDICIIAGEGATCSDNCSKTDERLQKVYINRNSIVAFAGGVWLNEELKDRNYYVPNLIEDFQKEENVYENGIALAKELSSRLKKHNDKINCELFIAIKNENTYDLLIHNTIENSNIILSPNKNFSVHFSKHNEIANNWLNELFLNEWQVFFNVSKNDHFLYDEKLHTFENLSGLIKKFYSEAFKFNWIDAFVVGASVDIAVLNKNGVRFFQKENRSAYDY